LRTGSQTKFLKSSKREETRKVQRKTKDLAGIVSILFKVIGLLKKKTEIWSNLKYFGKDTLNPHGKDFAGLLKTPPLKLNAT